MGLPCPALPGLGGLVGNLAERKDEGREMCWTIVWHFKQNPDALMCFFSHKCWVRQVCILTGGTTLLIPVVPSALTPSCCSCVPSDCSAEQETFFLHPKRMFIGAGIAGAKLRDTKWPQIGASVAPSPFFSRGNFGSFGNFWEKAAPNELLVPQDGAARTLEWGGVTVGTRKTWLVSAPEHAWENDNGRPRREEQREEENPKPSLKITW